MCMPNHRVRPAAFSDAAPTSRLDIARPPTRNVGVTLAAFRNPTQLAPGASSAAISTPLPSLSAQTNTPIKSSPPPALAILSSPGTTPVSTHPSVRRTSTAVQGGVSTLADQRRRGAKPAVTRIRPGHEQQQPDRLAQLAAITQDYQVDDDSPATVNYLFSGNYVNEAESRVLNDLALKRGVTSLWEFRRIQKKALDATGAVVGLPHENQIPRSVIDSIIRTRGRDNLRAYNKLWRRVDGHSDAFRHAYWNALMTKAFGDDFALAFGASHERVPNNAQIGETMDLYNNEVGRRIAQLHPDATEDQLAILVRAALRQGMLVVVGQDGKLAWSNMVKWGEHGLSPAAPGRSRGAKMSLLESLPYEK